MPPLNILIRIGAMSAMEAIFGCNTVKYSFNYYNKGLFPPARFGCYMSHDGNYSCASLPMTPQHLRCIALVSMSSGLTTAGRQTAAHTNQGDAAQWGKCCICT